MQPICPLRPRGTKKAYRTLFGPACVHWCAHAQDRAEPILFGLQEAHVTVVDSALPTRGSVGALGQLGSPSQHERRLPAGSQRAAMLAALAVAARYYRGGHGLHRRGQQTTAARTLAGGSGYSAQGEHESGGSIRNTDPSGLSARTA